MKEPKIVVIGGGTGSFALLNGLKKYSGDVTALVSMADDGGSTGLLRDELGVLPPGDVRKALVALARTPQMRELFDYRFREGTLAGHSFGNLFLTAVEKMNDNFSRAVELAGKVLNIQGRVLPITLDKVTLVLEEANGRVTRGESPLDDPQYAFETPRPEVRLEPAARITPEAEAAIKEADLVVIAPGSLYSSLAAALVVGGVAEALAATRAKKVFVCNLVSEHGQTDGMTVCDLAAEVERFMQGAKLDFVVYNTHKPPEKLLKRYAGENRVLVTFDDKALGKQHYTAIGGNYMANGSSYTKFIRHDGAKTAETLLKIARSHGKVRRMNVTKAIIPMAGYGTRRLPVTKALEKEMLPVGNRPVIDYVVEDCLRAGITEIYFVVGEEFDQVKRYYGQNQILEDYLENKGKTKELEEVRALNKKARFHYVVQDQYQPYGTAVPVALCAHLIPEDEQVLVLMGDDFIYNEDGSSEVAHLLDAVEAAGATAGVLATRVPKEEVSRYGVFEMTNMGGHEYFKRIVEQPKVEDAPSNLINISKYLFDHKMLEAVKKVMQDPPAANGEYQIIKALNYYVADGGKLPVVPIKGEYLDCGTPEGWLYANQRIINSKSS